MKEQSKFIIELMLWRRNKLTYVSKSKGEELYPYDFKHISDILDKHDLQIRAEIDAEIESLEKEIETL